MWAVSRRIARLVNHGRAFQVVVGAVNLPVVADFIMSGKTA